MAAAEQPAAEAELPAAMEENMPPPSAQRQTFRLFVTGWPPALGPDAVVQKLSSFGRVASDLAVSRRKPLGGGDGPGGGESSPALLSPCPAAPR